MLLPDENQKQYVELFDNFLIDDSMTFLKQIIVKNYLKLITSIIIQKKVILVKVIYGVIFSYEKGIFDKINERGAGSLIGVDILDVYLQKYNINCIISGHQDSINSGFIFYNKISNFKTSSKYPEELYEPIKIESSLNYNIRNSKIIENREEKCILGVITSSDYEAKDIKFDHYLQLEK